MTQLTDDDTDRLLDRVAAGQDDAVRVLFDRYRGRLRRLLSIHLDRRMAARVDPSDVIQEALTEAAMTIQDFAQRRPLGFYPWLRQITWKHLINTWRHHVETGRRSVDREQDARELDLGLSRDSRQELARQFTASELSPSAAAMREERQVQVNEALERLAKHDRDVLVMRYLEQLSLREISEVLGVSEAAARQRHVRALKRLQRYLRPEDTRE